MPVIDDTKPMWRDYLVYDARGHFVAEDRRYNDLTISGSADGLNWTGAKPDARAPFEIYCRETGERRYGYIGQAITTGFINDRIAPDYAVNPPKPSRPSFLKRLFA